jgi:hypothetical protein
MIEKSVGNYYIARMITLSQAENTCTTEGVGKSDNLVSGGA